GGLDREPVKLRSGCPVVEPADRLGGDPQRVDVVKPARDALHGANDLVHVYRLDVAVPCADLHGGAPCRHRSPSRVRYRTRGRRGLRACRRPSRAASDHRTRSRAARWQVFGLAGVPVPSAYWPSLPRLIRPSAELSPALTAVVPPPRGGAAPDPHRVPSCLERAWMTRPTQLRRPPYVGATTRARTTYRSACRTLPSSCFWTSGRYPATSPRSS